MEDKSKEEQTNKGNFGYKIGQFISGTAGVVIGTIAALSAGFGIMVATNALLNTVAGFVAGVAATAATAYKVIPAAAKSIGTAINNRLGKAWSKVFGSKENTAEVEIEMQDFAGKEIEEKSKEPEVPSYLKQENIANKKSKSTERVQPRDPNKSQQVTKEKKERGKNPTGIKH